MSLRSICTKLITSDKKLRQRLSTNALRFGFATTRTSQQTVDAYDVRFALGLLKDATDNKPAFDAELKRIGAESGASCVISTRQVAGPGLRQGPREVRW